MPPQRMLIPITPSSTTSTSSPTGRISHRRVNVTSYESVPVMQHELLSLRLTTFMVTMPLLFGYVIISSSPQYRLLHTIWVALSMMANMVYHSMRLLGLLSVYDMIII
jgi:hypothetical protein